MIVKATKEYKKLEGKDNPLIDLSPVKHNKLLAGETIDLTVIPKSLEKYLVKPDEKKVESKAKTKKENK